LSRVVFLGYYEGRDADRKPSIEFQLLTLTFN